MQIRPLFNNRYCYMEQKRYFLLAVKEKRYLIPDQCPHRGGPLSLGVWNEKRKTVCCPWHGAVYSCHFLLKKSIAALRVHHVLYVIDSIN